MSYLNNFLFRLKQYARDNRAKLIRAAIYGAVAVVVIILVLLAVEKVQQWSYERGVAAKDNEVRAKEAEAKEHEARANVLALEIEVKDAMALEWEKRARAAEWKLTETGRNVALSRKTYEEIRLNPDVPVDISDCSACQELARAGHPCK